MTPPLPERTTSPALTPTTRRVVLVLAVALPVLALAVGAWNYRWMSDDGFINLRVVRNLAQGHGPVFNAGERVEASTSPLWIGVLYVVDLLTPLRLEWVAVLTGIALSLAGLTLACLGAVRLHDRDSLVVPVGAVVLVAIAPMWKFASSGLENGLTFAWIGASFLALATWARDDDRRPGLGTAVLVGLGPLIRPELAILSAALVALLAFGTRGLGWGRRFGLLGAAVALPVLYEIFRMGYYASLVPNSALAKEASRPYWSAGWRYLDHAVDPYWLWVPLLILGIGAYLPLLLRDRGPTRRRLVMLVFLGAGLVDGLYIVRVGGDFMQARLLLPALFMICAPVAIVPVRRATIAALLVVPWAVVAAASLRAGVDAPQAFGPEGRNAITVADFGYGPGGPAQAFFDGHGVYFITHRLPGTPSHHDPALATYGVGVVSYALGSDTYVLDLLGLGDAFTSHLRLDRRGTIAHEKPLPFPWIVARLLRPGAPVTEADFVLPSFFLARRIDHPGGEAFSRRVADGRVALRCSGLADFLDHITEPMSVGQFFDNLAAAPANTALRIPPEPRAARAKFCG